MMYDEDFEYVSISVDKIIYETLLAQGGRPAYNVKRAVDYYYNIKEADEQKFIEMFGKLIYKYYDIIFARSKKDVYNLRCYIAKKDYNRQYNLSIVITIMILFWFEYALGVEFNNV